MALSHTSVGKKRKRQRKRKYDPQYRQSIADAIKEATQIGNQATKTVKAINTATSLGNTATQAVSGYTAAAAAPVVSSGTTTSASTPTPKAPKPPGYLADYLHPDKAKSKSVAGRYEKESEQAKKKAARENKKVAKLAKSIKYKAPGAKTIPPALTLAGLTTGHDRYSFDRLPRKEQAKYFREAVKGGVKEFNKATQTRRKGLTVTGAKKEIPGEIAHVPYGRNHIRLGPGAARELAYGREMKENGPETSAVPSSLTVLFHELAHTRQEPGLPHAQSEGGAEQIANRVAKRLGYTPVPQDFRSYPDERRKLQKKGINPFSTLARKSDEVPAGVIPEAAIAKDKSGPYPNFTRKANKSLSGSVEKAQEGTSAVLNAIALSKQKPKPKKAAVAVPEIVPPQWRKTVAKEGQMLEPALKEAGINMTGPEYLARLIQFESGWQKGQVSSAGAKKLGQFMPETRATFVTDYGVDPYGSPKEQIKGAAMHASGDFGHPPLYGGYNPGYSDTDPIPSVPGGKNVTVKLPKKALKMSGSGDTATLAGADIGKLRGPRPQIKAFKRAVETAQNIDAANLPYKLDHSNSAGVGKIPGPKKAGYYDCSSFVSTVLQRAGVPGFKNGALVSGQMGSAEGMAPGPGAITVFYNDSHTFMRIGGKYYGTSSSMSAADPGGSTGGGGMLNTSQAAPYANSGEFQVAHVTGLEGLKGSKVSTKGVEIAPGGTTATLTASTPVGAPGPSDLPPTPAAQLSPAQRAQIEDARQPKGRSVSRSLRAIDSRLTTALTAPTPEINQELIDRILSRS